MTTSAVSPADKVKQIRLFDFLFRNLSEFIVFLHSSVTQTPTDKEEEEEEEEKQQDKASRTARVQPTPQTRDAAAESPSTPSSDRRK